jgi:hypothetical protein
LEGRKNRSERTQTKITTTTKRESKKRNRTQDEREWVSSWVVKSRHSRVLTFYSNKWIAQESGRPAAATRGISYTYSYVCTTLCILYDAATPYYTPYGCSNSSFLASARKLIPSLMLYIYSTFHVY